MRAQSAGGDTSLTQSTPAHCLAWTRRAGTRREQKEVDRKGGRGRERARETEEAHATTRDQHEDDPRARAIRAVERRERVIAREVEIIVNESMNGASGKAHDAELN